MRFFKEMIIVIITAITVVYLFLPSLLPDIVPLVGWLDEGLATTILLSALKHWGLDLTGLFGNEDTVKQIAPASEDDIIINADGQKMQKVRIPKKVFEQAMRDYQLQQAQGRQ